LFSERTFGHELQRRVDGQLKTNAGVAFLITVLCDPGKFTPDADTNSRSHPLDPPTAFVLVLDPEVPRLGIDAA